MAEPELGQPFCGLTAPELAEVGEDCRWRHSPVSIAHAMELPRSNITTDQITGIFREVVALWGSVCGIDLQFQGDPNANIFARVEPMDGPNGVLGESYLPCGNVNARTQLAQRYDAGELWTVDFLKRVVLHEVGHALGLPHAPRGSGAVMEPFLTALATPQRWDVERMVARYGPPRPVVIPDPPPVPPAPPGEPAIDLLGSKLLKLPSGVVVQIAQPGAYLFRVARGPRPDQVRVSLAKR